MVDCTSLAGLAFGRFGDSFVEDKIPDVLVEMKLLKDYSINIGQADVIKQLNEQIQSAGASGEQMRNYYANLSKKEANTFINGRNILLAWPNCGLGSS